MFCTIGFIVIPRSLELNLFSDSMVLLVLSVLFGSFTPLDEVGTAPLCLLDRPSASPGIDLRVVPAQQHVRHSHAAILGRPRIVRVIEQPVTEGLAKR